MGNSKIAEESANTNDDSYQVIDPNLSDEEITDAVMMQMFGGTDDEA